MPTTQKSGFRRPGSNAIQHRYYLPIAVFAFTFLCLAFVQMKVSKPLILLERFYNGAGWLEILIISLYAAFVSFKMQDPVQTSVWRRRIWTIFSVAFFAQLIIGLLGTHTFLMTGKLHLPVPVMILSGPLYRGQLSVMSILFLSTLVLTGPAWCSQLCYFGAFDSLAARGKIQKRPILHKQAIKTTLLFLVITGTLSLRWMNVSAWTATLIGIAFGITGIGIMILISSKKGKMIHCVLYCPVGTIVHLVKPVNPFRMFIDDSCTLCQHCTSHCRYDALNLPDLKNKKPGFTCTFCGDCLASCHSGSIKYRFLHLKPENARTLYLFLTVSLHAIFLALARI
jgi:ferredoxin